MGSHWLDKLHRNEIVLNDGGTGTELQKRGVPMDEIVWSGAAVLSHPDIVREIHEDYIQAGAEVIIANTFGSTRQMLEPAGYGEQVELVNRRAVELAIQARDNVATSPVAVAGSISAMPPGFDRHAYLSPEDESASYREAAEILVDSGVDLLALEMMEDLQHAPRAIEAACDMDVPLWLGVSCRRRQEDEQLVSFGYQELAIESVFDRLLPMQPDIVSLMHSPIDAIPGAVALLRNRWTGPIGVYPESGYFTQPNWNFIDVIPPEDFVQEAIGWVQSGVRLLGGCCGTGPDHIRALRDALPELRAAI